MKYRFIFLLAFLYFTTNLSAQFYGNYMVYCKDNMYGLALVNGKSIITPKYDSIDYVNKSTNLFYVEFSKKWNIVDSNGAQLYKAMQIGNESELTFYGNELVQFVKEKDYGFGRNSNIISMYKYRKIQLGVNYYYKLDNGLYLNTNLDTAFTSFDEEIFYNKIEDVVYANINDGVCKYYLSGGRKDFYVNAVFTKNNLGFFRFVNFQTDSTTILDSNYKIVFQDRKEYEVHSQNFLKANFEPYDFYDFNKKIALKNSTKDLQVVDIHRQEKYAIVMNKKRQYALYDILNKKNYSFGANEKKFIGNVYYEIKDSIIALYNFEDILIKRYNSKNIHEQNFIEIGNDYQKSILSLDGKELIPYEKHSIRYFGYNRMVKKGMYSDLYDSTCIKKYKNIINLEDNIDTIIAYSTDSIYIMNKDLNCIKSMKLFGPPNSVRVKDNEILYSCSNGKSLILDRIEVIHYGSRTCLGYHTQDGIIIINDNNEVLTSDNFFPYNYPSNIDILKKFGYLFLKNKGKYTFRLVNFDGVILYEGSDLKYLNQGLCAYNTNDGLTIFQNLNTNKILKTVKPPFGEHVWIEDGLIKVYINKSIGESLNLKGSTNNKNKSSKKDKNELANETEGYDISINEKGEVKTVGYVDVNLNYVLPPKYIKGTIFSDGYAFVVDSKNNSPNDGAIIDKAGNIKGYFSCQEVIPLNDGFFKYKFAQGGPEGVFDIKGQIIVPAKGSNQFISYKKGYFFVRSEGGTKVYNTKGTIIFSSPLNYNLGDVSGNCIYFNEGNKTILYNVTLKKQKEFDTSYLQVYFDKYTIVNINDKKYIFDLDSFDYYK